MIISHKKSKVIYYIVLLITGIGFFFLLGQDGYVCFSDSIVYLEPTEFISERYILYPLFLQTFKFLFGSEGYLNAVFGVQSALAFLVSWISTEYFRKRYRLSYFWSVLIYFCLFLPYGYSLPENVATHHILTEGLSFTLFHLFLLCIIRTFLDSSWKSMLLGIVWLIFLIALRNQLLFLVPVYFVLVVCFIVKQKKLHIYWIENKYKILILLVALFIGINIFFIWLISSGKFLQATIAVSGRVSCLIESDDERIFDGSEREICQELYKAIMEEETNTVFFRPGLKGWEDIANASNENTKIFEAVVQDYCLKNPNDKLNENIYGVITSITGRLLQEHYLEYWGMTLILCLESLVLSIFIQPSIIFDLCNMTALLLYVFSGFLFIKVKKQPRKMELCVPYLIMMFALLANVIVTNMFFYGMQRYIVYTFGYFYLSLVMFLQHVVGKNALIE